MLSLWLYEEGFLLASLFMKKDGAMGFPAHMKLRRHEVLKHSRATTMSKGGSLMATH